MNYNLKAYVFDLDGTLMESHKTIYKAMVCSFNNFNIKYSITQDQFNNHIGMHFEDIFKIYSIDVPDFDKFLTFYKKSYFNFINHSVLFPEVTSTLDKLIKSGKQIALLTTKAQDQADLIINHFGLAKYFTTVMGRRDGIPHKPDPSQLLMICDKYKIDPRECIMVGDTELDIRCGKNAGSKTCAVTFGYREPEFLKNEFPDFLINSFDSLLNI